MAQSNAVAAGDERGATLSLALFERVAARVEAKTGIVLKSHKLQMVQTRLAKRLRALGLDTFESYVELIESPAGASEEGPFINAVTTNLTSFFREAHHLEDLRDTMLAPLAAAGQRRVRIWSAGCSTGEEPYSIAMTALGLGGAARGWDLKILATDLDTDVLARAAAGIYEADRIEAVPKELLGAAVTRLPDGRIEMRQAAKSLISFKQLNLLGDWPFAGPFDVIFCRNVLIYFSAEMKARLVDRYASMLTPTGTLYLGHSESLLGEHAMLRSDGRTIYRRR